MHPSDRPASVAEFRKELFSSQPPEPIVDHLIVRAGRRWGSALRENALLLLLVLILLVVALIATILSPSLPR